MDYIKEAYEPQTIHLTKNILFVDIETTGLCKHTNYIFCIGIFYMKENIFFKEQWLIQKNDEEKQLLLVFLKRIEDFSTLCTYSGASFDIPFLCERLQLHKVDATILLNKTHLDIKKLPFLKYLLKQKKLSRFSLEESLGYQRHLTISGKDIVKLHQTYTLSPLEQYKVILAEHNKEELLGIYHLYQFFIGLTKLHFLDKIGGYEKENCFYFDFKFNNDLNCSFNMVLEDLLLDYKHNTAILSLGLPLYCCELKHYLLSYKDYYYIPSQNQILHHSLAQFIPSSMKQRATKEQCTIRKKSLFVKILKQEKLFLDEKEIWYDEEGTAFIEKAMCDEKTLWKIIKKIINPRL